MNRYGGSSLGSSSKATASTLCQKCLKRDIFECKAVTQERPYVSRPSRTQQLFNPKLLPKLTSDVPQDLLRKKGIADEQLAKIEKDRGRKRERQDKALEPSIEENHQRSASSSSSGSVATISTNASGSPRFGRETTAQQAHRRTPAAVPLRTSDRKRRRSDSSDGSFHSDMESSRGQRDMASMRSTRRKIRELSPPIRGRRRSRADSGSGNSSYSSRSRSQDNTRPVRGLERKPRPEPGTYRPGRSNSRSPQRRSGQRSPSDSDTRRRGLTGESRSQNRRPRQSGWTRSSDQEDSRRRLANPDSIRQPRDRSFSSDNIGHRRYSGLDDHRGRSSGTNEEFARTVPHSRRAPPRDRSLSPFSKRLALTQAMNTGR